MNMIVAQGCRSCLSPQTISRSVCISSAICEWNIKTGRMNIKVVYTWFTSLPSASSLYTCIKARRPASSSSRVSDLDFPSVWNPNFITAVKLLTRSIQQRKQLYCKWREADAKGGRLVCVCVCR